MEAIKRLSSMPAFHHHHQNGGGGSRKKTRAMEESSARRRKDASEEERDERSTSSEEEEDEEEEDVGGEGERARTKKLSRSKSFKMKLLQKIGRGASSSSTKEDKKGLTKMEKRKEKMIKSYDKKAQLDSSRAAASPHRAKEIPTSAAMCMNLPGYKSHIKRSASSSSASSSSSSTTSSAMNNRGRQAADRTQQQANNSMLLFEETKALPNGKDRHHRGELRLGVFSPTSAPSAKIGRPPSPSSPAASSSSHAMTSAAKNKKESEGELGKKEKSHHRNSFLPGVSTRHHNQRPSSAAGQDAGPVVTGSSRASGNFDSGEGEYVDRGEEGIDLMELQRQFQQVGAAGSGVGGAGAGSDERRARGGGAAEDRVKGGARLPWWGLNASSGKEGRRKEWERFFSGFKVSELWEDDEGEDEDEEDVDGCGGKKVPYLTEETTVKEALDVMSERGLNALPICLKEVDSCDGDAKAKAAADSGDGSQEDEVRERALRHLRKWRKTELVRERERKQRKQRGKTVLGWIDLRDLLTFAVFKFPRPPSAETGIDEVRRQGIEFTQHKIRELVNIYGMNGAHVVNEEGTGGQGRHRIAANDRMPAVFRMLRSEKGLRVLPVYDQSQLPAESRCLVRVLDTNAVVKWLHRIVQDNRMRSPFVRELANRQVRHWGAFADAILGKELIYFETEEMINNFDHFRASKRERRMSKLIVPFGSADGGSTVEVISKKSTNGKSPSPPPPSNDHAKEKIDLNKHLFTISADRSVIDAFKILYNYKVSSLGVLEKKGKERDMDDQSSSSGSSSESEEESDSSSDSEDEEEHIKAKKNNSKHKKKTDQEKARGPSLKEAKAMVEAARDSSSDESDESESESESEESASDTEPGDRTTATADVVDRPGPRANSPHDFELEAAAHTKPMRSQSDPLGLSASKRANAHDASDMVKSRSGSKEWRDPSLGSRNKKPPSRGITREEMVVRAAQAGKLISHLSSSDLKHFEPYAMMRCLHMPIKEYLGCFKEKKPLVTCRRNTTLLQILEKMAHEEVNRVWLLADEEDEDEDAASGHDRKSKQQQPKPKDNSGRPIGMISLADVITEVTRL